MSELDPELSRLYRQVASELPAAALDAAILAAARKQAATPRQREDSQRQRPSSWWNWMAPASAIATLVLGVSVALLVERERTETMDDSSMRRTLPPASPPAGRVSESAQAKAPGGAAPEPAEKKQAPAAAAPVPARVPVFAAPVQAPAPRPAEPPPAAQAFPAERRARASAPRMVAPKAEIESDGTGDAAPGAAGAAAASAVAGKLSPPRQQAAQRSPEAWLEEISRLKLEGRDKEAAERLAEFRKAYPAHAVPQKLRALE